MPVYGQGPFLCESINSALMQETSYNYRIILMDDNCPQQETVNNCRRYSRRFPDKIHYFRSPVNRGLAAMRNQGVKIALELWPELFSVVSFDGDDRLHPYFIERSVTELRNAQTESAGDYKYGWIYEDPDHFGIDGLMLRTHGYSSLYSMAGCSNCPTSLTNADIYRSGIWFREEMKNGSEDWQFWLQALEAGYKGKFVPHLGFRYRRRPGSMATTAYKSADRNKTEIRISLPDIYHPDYFLRQESQESPRYAIITYGDSKQNINTSIPHPFINIDNYIRQLAGYKKLPTNPIPQYLVFCDNKVIVELYNSGLLNWILWRLEDIADKGNISCINILPPKSNNNLLEISTDKHHSTEFNWADISMISSKLMLDVLSNKKSFINLKEKKRIRQANIHIRGIPKSNVAHLVKSSIENMEILYKKRYLAQNLLDFQVWRPFGLERYDMSREFFSAKPIFCSGSESNKILIVANDYDLESENICSFVKKITEKFHYYKQDVSLLVLGECISKNIGNTFADFMLIHQYLDKKIYKRNINHESLLGLLLPFNSVITVGCGILPNELNQLRSYGRNIIGILHKFNECNMSRESMLMNCFKIYKGIYSLTPEIKDMALANGISYEQIINNGKELIELTKESEDIPA